MLYSRQKRSKIDNINVTKQINMSTKRINFDNDYGYGYIDVTDRGDERNTTHEIIVEETYGDATEEDVVRELFKLNIL